MQKFSNVRGWNLFDKETWEIPSKAKDYKWSARQFETITQCHVVFIVASSPLRRHKKNTSVKDCFNF